MSFLKINGITIPVKDGGANQSLKRTGDQKRSGQGNVVDSTTSLRREFKITTTMLSAADSDTVVAMVESRAHLFKFADGFASSTGLFANPSNGVIWEALPGVGGDQGRIKMDDLATLTIPIGVDSETVKFGGTPTILFHSSTDGGMWDSVASSGATVYRNGVASAFTNFDIYGSDLNLIIENTSGTTIYLSQLVLCEFPSSNAALQAWSSITNEAVWGPSPILKITGDIVPEKSIYCNGTNTDIEYSQIGKSGGWDNAAKSVTFTLCEADESFVSGIFPDEVDDPILALNPLVYFRPEDIGPIGGTASTIWVNKGSYGPSYDMTLISSPSDSEVIASPSGHPAYKSVSGASCYYQGAPSAVIDIPTEHVFGQYNGDYLFDGTLINGATGAMLVQSSRLRIGNGGTAPEFALPVSGEYRFCGKNHATLSEVELYVNGAKRPDPIGTPVFTQNIGRIRSLVVGTSDWISCFAIFPAGTPVSEVASAFEKRFG